MPRRPKLDLDIIFVAKRSETSLGSFHKDNSFLCFPPAVSFREMIHNFLIYNAKVPSPICLVHTCGNRAWTPIINIGNIRNGIKMPNKHLCLSYQTNIF